MSVAVDPTGNVYVAGSTNGALASANAGGMDAFVRKLDSLGNTTWTQQFGTSGDDWARSIAVDGDGNVYVAGDTTGGLAGANLGFGTDSYLRKLDASGTVLWMHQFGSPGSEELRAVAVDAAGNAYVSGSTYPNGQSSGNPYVRKFDSAGNTVWAKELGGDDEDEAQAVAVDSAGHVYVGGWTYHLTAASGLGSWDAFVYQLDSNGAVQWSSEFGTPEGDEVDGAAVDSQGNVYVAGSTQGSLVGSSTSASHAFVRKFDPSGSVLWTRETLSAASEYAAAIRVDSSDNAYLAGSTTGALSGTNAGMQDAFVRKLDPSGATLWTKQVGTAGDEAAYDVAVAANGTIYLVGYKNDLQQVDAFAAQFSAE